MCEINPIMPYLCAGKLTVCCITWYQTILMAKKKPPRLWRRPLKRLIKLFYGFAYAELNAIFDKVFLDRIPVIIG